MKHLPNILTLARIFMIPALIAVFYWDTVWVDWIACGLFFVASITDFFDGYLARIYGSTSKLGQFLDPIADKLMVAAVLVMCVFDGRIFGIHVIAALIILLREIMVSGLREFLSGQKVSVPVTNMAKWKTAFQMFALGAFLLNKSAPFGLPAVEIGIACIWLAAILTTITGYQYLKAGLKHMDS